MTEHDYTFAVNTPDYGIVALSIFSNGGMLARRMEEERGIQLYNPGALAGTRAQRVIAVDDSLTCADGRTLGAVVNELWKSEENLRKAVAEERSQYDQQLLAKGFSRNDCAFVTGIVTWMEVFAGTAVSPKRQKGIAYTQALSRRAGLYGTVRQALVQFAGGV